MIPYRVDPRPANELDLRNHAPILVAFAQPAIGQEGTSGLEVRERRGGAAMRLFRPAPIGKIHAPMTVVRAATDECLAACTSIRGLIAARGDG